MRPRSENLTVEEIWNKIEIRAIDNYKQLLNFVCI